MALPQVPAFTPAAYAQMNATSASSSAAIPGSGNQTLRITNLGSAAVFVSLSSGAGTVTPATGVAILPNSTEYLGIGIDNHINAITDGGVFNIPLNLAAGA